MTLFAMLRGTQFQPVFLLVNVRKWVSLKTYVSLQITSSFFLLYLTLYSWTTQSAIGILISVITLWTLSFLLFILLTWTLIVGSLRPSKRERASVTLSLNPCASLRIPSSFYRCYYRHIILFYPWAAQSAVGNLIWAWILFYHISLVILLIFLLSVI